ncbi:hypothetical protein Cs7R123_08820 [Catellatospora sp. TT07R-123]|uniref:hypothetical protein n=1 Tax=Catellatospora sp. TT07R-123 TaxID=2733863 RepID=UPI001B2B9489|nr:hypothetical protein [Catellatospora sp. TT07R-123]GHJ43540.1 hypothetical protein Cs7R123_08820 [Catellatospora sp. TT07R-123]
MAGKQSDVTAAAEQVVDTAVQAGRAVADRAAAVRDDAVAAAAAATHRAGEAAAVAKDRAGEVVHAVAERMPHGAGEWEAVGRDIVDSVRRNPRPWLVGAGIFAFAWLLGRGSARTK